MLPYALCGDVSMCSIDWDSVNVDVAGPVALQTDIPTSLPFNPPSGPSEAWQALLNVTIGHFSPRLSPDLLWYRTVLRDDCLRVCVSWVYLRLRIRLREWRTKPQLDMIYSQLKQDIDATGLPWFRHPMPLCFSEALTLTEPWDKKVRKDDRVVQ
jgi:hypothetical protein